MGVEHLCCLVNVPVFTCLANPSISPCLPPPPHAYTHFVPPTTPPCTRYPLLRVVGGHRKPGPLQFNFSSFGGWMAFTPSHTLVVSEYNFKRVQEVDVVTGAHVRFLGQGHLTNPTGIAVSDALIAVAGGSCCCCRDSYCRLYTAHPVWQPQSRVVCVGLNIVFG